MTIVVPSQLPDETRGRVACDNGASAARLEVEVPDVADDLPCHLPPPNDAQADDLAVAGGRVAVTIPARSGRVLARS